MPKVVVLNLEGPLQSWAGTATARQRVDTLRQPGTSAVLGMLAAAFGVPRGGDLPAALQDICDEHIQVETLRPGKIVRDFQTIGNQVGVTPRSRPHDDRFAETITYILTGARIKHGVFVFPGSSGASTAVVNRTYLGDAQFLVSVRGTDDDATTQVHERLRHPVWSPYLGRRAFSPVFPFVLGMWDEADASVEARRVLAAAGREVADA